MMEIQPITTQLRSIIAGGGLTTYRLAKICGTIPISISRFLKGERGLTTETWDRIGLGLGLRLVDDVMKS